MPRKPRELIDDGIYHIFNRGNDRMNLFCEEQDCDFFLKHILICKRKMAFELYHYCLMTNHFHLLIRVKRGSDLSLFMHDLQLAYVRYFKRKYKFLGHLFQQRFKSPRISEESYFLQCGRYIERNPVSAKLVKEPSEHVFSSASFYVSGLTSELITPNPYYETMGGTPEERRMNYARFIAVDEPYGNLVDEALTLA